MRFGDYDGPERSDVEPDGSWKLHREITAKNKELCRHAYVDAHAIHLDDPCEACGVVIGTIHKQALICPRCQRVVCSGCHHQTTTTNDRSE